MVGWSNWSGNVRAPDARVVVPADEGEVVEVVRDASHAGTAVRVGGAGHSFTPLCATDGSLVLLDRLAGVRRADLRAGTAEIRAGTRLHALGEPLAHGGLALHNQGDVDVQTLAGAIGTGTHGTGPELGSLSTAVVGSRVVTASGDVVDCDADHEPEVFQAARLSLGALGIITRVRLQLVPAYHLHERVWWEDLDESLDRLDERIAATRHYEFFWWPTLDRCEHKSLHPTEHPPDLLPDRAGERIDRSYRIFPSPRDLRFNEIEYAVPADAGPACFAAVRDVLRIRHPEAQWPVEYRTLAADDVWLSPAYERASVTISVHEDHRRPWRDLFAACEEVFRAFDGRPHWGKLHSLDAEQLAPRFPCWDRFWAVRAALDPEGRFASPYLRRIGGF